MQKLIDGVQGALEHSLIEEEKVPLSEVTNLQEVHDEIVGMLTELRDKPNRIENPMIYHLDVGALNDHKYFYLLTVLNAFNFQLLCIRILF